MKVQINTHRIYARYCVNEQKWMKDGEKVKERKISSELQISQESFLCVF